MVNSFGRVNWRQQLASETGANFGSWTDSSVTAASLHSAPAGQNAFSIISFAMTRRLTKAWRMKRRGFALALIVLSAACGSTSLSASQTAPALGHSPQRVTTPLPIVGPLRPIPNPPFPRSLSATAYDPLSGQTVMFGGLSNDGTLPDTWSWDGMSWTEHHSAIAPHSRFDGLLAFDPAVGGLVLIGGDPKAPTSPAIDADIRSTWVWQGSIWRRLNTAHTPIPANYYFGWHALMAYDAASRELILVGVSGGPHIATCSAETWTFDGTDWRMRKLSEALPATVRVLITDAGTGSVLAVVNPRRAIAQIGFVTPTCQPGSFDARALAATTTFMWTGNTWKQVSSGGPAASVAGDVGGSTLGSHAVLVSEDARIWLWTGTAWQLKASSTTPEGRSYAALAQDRNGRLLMFGGDIQVAPWYLGDTWLWDGQRWSLVPVSGPPASAAR